MIILKESREIDLERLDLKELITFSIKTSNISLNTTELLQMIIVKELKKMVENDIDFPKISIPKIIEFIKKNRPVRETFGNYNKLAQTFQISSLDHQYLSTSDKLVLYAFMEIDTLLPLLFWGIKNE